jgi:ABC-type uncharacterized transport system ATPase subunit
VDGNGQTELVEAITGMRKAEAGRIFLKGNRYYQICRSGNGLRQRWRTYPQTATSTALILDYSIENNLVLKVYYQCSPFPATGC